MTTKEPGFDLASLDTVAASEKPIEIELMHPVTSVPLGVFVSVIGKDAKEFRDYLGERANETARRTAINRKRGLIDPVATADQVFEEGTDLLTLCMKGWRNVVFEGKTLEFTPDNVKTVLTRLLWFRTQVDEAIGDLGRFFKKSAKN